MTLKKRTPAQITSFLNDNSHKMDHPAAFIGKEPNTYTWTEEEWDSADLKVLIISPFDRLQSMGNTTVPLLYQLSNEYNRITRITERWYMPASRRDFDIFKKFDIPPFGLETRHALGEYDVIAASLSYYPYWFNVVQSLVTAGMPPRARDRTDMKEQYPLVMLGGHVFANPWTTAPSIDVLWCGEAEDESLEAQETAQALPRDERVTPNTYWVKPKNSPGFNGFLDDVTEYKKRGMLYTQDGREEMLHELSLKHRHIMVPRFYSTKQEKAPALVPETAISPREINQTLGWDKAYSDLPDRIIKRIVKNLDAVTIPIKPPLPMQDCNLIGTVQSARGCSYRCSFCAASYREVPYRERSEDVMLEAMTENLKWTGASEMSPFQLEFGTYSRKKALVKNVLENLTDDVSMPALRIDVFGGDPVFGQFSVESQQKNLTLAIEGNSQRLREIVSKGIQEEDILLAFSNGVAAGYSTAKFYMILNLPGETNEDHEEVVELCKKLDVIRKSTGSGIRVRLSWKSLTIQPWLPFQWLPCRLRSTNFGPYALAIKDMGFGITFGGEMQSGHGMFLQVAEMADEVAGEALLDVILQADMVTYASLSRRIVPMIEEELAKRGRTIDDYYREKSTREILPWDIIDPLVTKAYLIRHYEMIQARLGGNPEVYGHGFLEKFGACSIGCAQCGACDDEMLDQMESMALSVDEPVKLSEIKIIDKKTIRQKFILDTYIDPTFRYCTDSFWVHLLRRACYINDIPIVTNPINLSWQRVKSTRPWFSGHTHIELGFTKALTPDQVDSLPDLLNPWMSPYGMTIKSMQPVAANYNAFGRNAGSTSWSLEMDVTALDLKAKLEKISNDPDATITRKAEQFRRGIVSEKIPFKEAVKDFAVTSEGRRVFLRCTLDSYVSPYDLANALVPRSDVHKYPAIIVAVLSKQSPTAFDDNCEMCGNPIPYVFDNQFDKKFCPLHVSLEESELMVGVS